MTYNSFIFETYAFDETTGALHLHYAFESGPRFEEKIVFPMPSAPLSPEQKGAFENACRLIHFLAGVSYYKAFVPPYLSYPAYGFDEETGAFLHKVYLNGLGEFAYRNQIDLSDKIRFHTRNVPQSAADLLPPSPRVLVPVGGGKDSIVTIEALKNAGKSMDLFVVCPPQSVPTPIAQTIEVSGQKALIVRRSLDPQLAKLNEQGAYNGHVPITAIISAIAVATAILHGHGAVVLSNEHSADAPNLQMNGLAINHQYSKSLDFEADFAAYVHKRVTPSVDYFSLLRPLSEAEIARRFAKLPRYFDVFRSCNKAFRQDAQQRLDRWCCDCPKCRFVFLALAPFIDKERLIALFGQNMLDTPAQRDGFDDLCGLGPHKPFECVGEIEECALLMNRLMRLDSWKNDCIVRGIKDHLWMEDDVFTPAYQALYQGRATHRLSEAYQRILDHD